MDAIDLIRRLHEHRQWVNNNLLETARQLSEAQLHATFEIGQGTIWKSLTHLYAAEFVWLESLLGAENPVAPGDTYEKLPGNQEGDRPIPSLPELIQHWDELNQRWATYLAELTADELPRMIFKFSSLTGIRSGTPVSDILIHVCTHAQYTIAQAVNMMRHAGVKEFPETMHIALSRKEFAAQR